MFSKLIGIIRYRHIRKFFCVKNEKTSTSTYCPSLCCAHHSSRCIKKESCGQGSKFKKIANRFSSPRTSKRVMGFWGIDPLPFDCIVLKRLEIFLNFDPCLHLFGILVRRDSLFPETNSGCSYTFLPELGEIFHSHLATNQTKI
jgi:hypothetical protein